MRETYDKLLVSVQATCTDFRERVVALAFTKSCTVDIGREETERG